MSCLKEQPKGQTHNPKPCIHWFPKKMVSCISHTPNFRSKMDLLTPLKDSRLQTFSRHSPTDFVCITCLRWTQPCAWKQNIFHGLFASSWMTAHLHRGTRVLLLFLNFPCNRVRLILEHPCSQSFLQKLTSRRETLKWERVLYETGNGDYGTSKGAHF